MELVFSNDEDMFDIARLVVVAEVVVEFEAVKF